MAFLRASSCPFGGYRSVAIFVIKAWKKRFRASKDCDLPAAILSG
jgi:hypothetical protein